MICVFYGRAYSVSIVIKGIRCDIRFFRNSFSFVRILPALSQFLEGVDLPCSMNDFLQRLSVIGLMLSLQHNSAKIIQMFDDPWWYIHFHLEYDMNFSDKSIQKGKICNTWSVFLWCMVYLPYHFRVFWQICRW